MPLRSLTIKGFKSFPDRTRLDFAPGVSVVVGPNGSGKSNVTDAVLWALGEQSPSAVRGQTMQDVIFAGAAGTPSRSVAEVEVVIDNGAGTLASDYVEVSIMRRLDRSGEGEYRLNGARARLTDVLEVLSDTGLGKEMHSVVSQGRIESIVHSRALDRRLLIEEAAGLGKHRRRRRRTELKLARTEQNLARARDVEREARSRLRPLKRQAEAAEHHARLERGQLEARLELALDAAREADARAAEAEAQALAARREREEGESRIAAAAAQREEAEAALAARAREREARASAAFAVRASADRVLLRADRATELERTAVEGARRRRAELEALRASAEADDAGAEEPVSRPIEEIEAELAALDAEREQRLERELEELGAAREVAERRQSALAEDTAAAREALRGRELDAERARSEQGQAERAVRAARRGAAEAGAELARVLRLVRSHTGASGEGRTLAEAIRPEPGYGPALAAALGPLLGAVLVDSVADGEALLEAAGDDGAAALAPPGAPAAPASAPTAPAPGAERLIDRVQVDGDRSELAAESAGRGVGGRVAVRGGALLRRAGRDPRRADLAAADRRAAPRARGGR